MDLQSKEIDPKWLDVGDEGPFDKVRYWISENNPLPYHVQWWFRDTDLFHPSRIYRKVSNIIRWIPILWRDVDWDSSALYDIVAFKLKNMREHHIEHHNHVGWEQVVEQIKTAEDAIRRVRDDDYLGKEWGEYHEKFPREPWLDVPGKPGWKQSTPLSKEKSDMLMKLGDEEEKLRKQDLETFASIFRDYSLGWWD